LGGTVGFGVGDAEDGGGDAALFDWVLGGDEELEEHGEGHVLGGFEFGGVGDHGRLRGEVESAER
jgi:hypothetical protein